MIVIFQWNKTKKIKPCFGILAYSTIFFLLNYFFDSIESNKLLWIYYPTYTILEFLFFFYILFIEITNKTVKRFFIFSSLIFILGITIFYSNEKIQRLDSLPIAFETILVYIFIFFYLKDKFNSLGGYNLQKQLHFWIVAGIMFYLSGTFFFNILANYLNPKQLLQFWHYSFLADIIKNIIFTIAIFYFANNSSKKIIPNQLPNLDFTN